MIQVSDFALKWADRTLASDVPILGTQSERRFLAFVIAGVRVSPQGADLISPLGWQPTGDDEIAAQRLLGLRLDPVLEGRVAVLVCPECGSAGCGAVTVVVDRSDDIVQWRDLASSEVDPRTGGWQHNRQGFAHWPELRFSADAYRTAIAERPPPLVSASERQQRIAGLLDEARQHFASRRYAEAAEAYDDLDAAGLRRADVKRRDIARSRS